MPLPTAKQISYELSTATDLDTLYTSKNFYMHSIFSNLFAYVDEELHLNSEKIKTYYDKLYSHDNYPHNSYAKLSIFLLIFPHLRNQQQQLETYLNEGFWEMFTSQPKSTTTVTNGVIHLDTYIKTLVRHGLGIAYGTEKDLFGCLLAKVMDSKCRFCTDISVVWPTVDYLLKKTTENGWEVFVNKLSNNLVSDLRNRSHLPSPLSLFGRSNFIILLKLASVCRFSTRRYSRHIHFQLSSTLLRISFEFKRGSNESQMMGYAFMNSLLSLYSTQSDNAYFQLMFQSKKLLRYQPQNLRLKYRLMIKIIFTLRMEIYENGSPLEFLHICYVVYFGNFCQSTDGIKTLRDVLIAYKFGYMLAKQPQTIDTDKAIQSTTDSQTTLPIELETTLKIASPIASPIGSPIASPIASTAEIETTAEIESDAETEINAEIEADAEIDSDTEIVEETESDDETDEEPDRPYWLDVIVEIILSLMVQPNRWTKKICMLVFRKLAPDNLKKSTWDMLYSCLSEPENLLSAETATATTSTSSMNNQLSLNNNNNKESQPIAKSESDFTDDIILDNATPEQLAELEKLSQLIRFGNPLKQAKSSSVTGMYRAFQQRILGMLALAPKLGLSKLQAIDYSKDMLKYLVNFKLPSTVKINEKNDGKNFTNKLLSTIKIMVELKNFSKSNEPHCCRTNEKVANFAAKHFVDYSYRMRKNPEFLKFLSVWFKWLFMVHSHLSLESMPVEDQCNRLLIETTMESVQLEILDDFLIKRNPLMKKDHICMLIMNPNLNERTLQRVVCRICKSCLRDGEVRAPQLVNFTYVLSVALKVVLRTHTSSSDYSKLLKRCGKVIKKSKSYPKNEKIKSNIATCNKLIKKLTEKCTHSN